MAPMTFTCDEAVTETASCALGKGRMKKKPWVTDKLLVISEEKDSNIESQFKRRGVVMDAKALLAGVQVNIGRLLPLALCHIREFVQVMKKINTATHNLKFGDNMHDNIMEKQNRVEFQSSSYYLMYAIFK